MHTVSEIQTLRLDPRLSDFGEIQGVCGQADRLVTAYRWKAQLGPRFPLIACLVGGTGTGKSTLFNSLAGEKISDVGMRRPCTLKAVVLAHEHYVRKIQDSPYLDDGMGTILAIVPHRQPELSPLVLVDTPDFDSVETSNRLIFENFFVISDIVIYVTSQEKYADHCGWEMLLQAIRWGKKTICVMNKVTSDAAYGHFHDNVLKLGPGITPVRVEKLDRAIEYIQGLRDRPPFLEILQHAAEGSEVARARELTVLYSCTTRILERLEDTIARHAERIASVNFKIGQILSNVLRGMDSSLDAIVTRDIEVQTRERLRTLLRKYDILFVPRMMVRNALYKLIYSVVDAFGIGHNSPDLEDRDQQLRAEDLQTARSAARLEPLDTAVAKLNLQIAEVLSSDSGLEDLRLTAREDVTRWDPAKIHSLYEEAFPGVEHLLEAEFNKFREGLSRSDEMKLYGSYTVWALFLITAEIIVGGGFTLFDAVLNTVIVPFIPKWLLNVKVVDLLREIGERVDREHRDTLHRIVESQAELYTTSFSKMVPDHKQIDHLRRLRLSLRPPTG